MPLLGANAAQDLDLLTVNNNFKRIASVSAQPIPSTKHAILENYATVFTDTVGTLLDPVHLRKDPGIQPVIMPGRKLPLSMEEPVKAELTDLITAGVLEPVDKPPPRVSQMAVVVKPTGKVRICLDLRGLNNALMREHHTLPTVDSMLHRAQRARVFSKADLHHGYWYCHLDEESSDLMTMATPFGRYKWHCLPFGLNVSTEIFGKRVQAAFKDLKNIHCIADDILICGYGKTTEAASKNHDEAMMAFLDRCREMGIVLNPDKFIFKVTEMPFMGHILTDRGILPDPAKVCAILEMPYPKDIAGVRRLCGCVNYLSHFIPHLANLVEPLHDLTGRGVAFTWNPHLTEAVEKLKTTISSAPLLTYFDTNAPVTVQCDASESGLGAVLLQRGRPVAYASHALTDPETRYAQIEKELLAVLFLMTKFDHMTYGCPVTVFSDHKPLAAVLVKPLSKAPRRLQSMIMQLQRYSFKLVWQPGKEMHIADCLSRAFPATPATDVKPAPPSQAKYAVNFMESLPYAEQQLELLKSETDDDVNLQLLKATIIKGWPEKRTDLPNELLPFWSYREELSVTAGIIFKEAHLVIPSTMRPRIQDLLHVGHRGIDAAV